MALALDGVRILLVEDHDDSLETLSSYLRLFGATVKPCPDGRSAIDCFEGFDPHVIVADLEMPGLNGWDMLTSLREKGVRKPAVAVSAHHTARDRERSERAGYRTHLSKPVTPAQLLAAVQAVIA